MKTSLIALFLVSTQLFAQNDTIAFKLSSHNNIIVPALIDDVDAVDLMFHTAVNSISLTNESLNRLKNTYDENETEIKTWGGQGTAAYSDGHKLSIGAVEWDSLRIWTSEKSGYDSDGKFGPNLFDGKYLEINFEKSILAIHTVLPSNLNEYSKFELIYEDGSMYISGDCSNGNRLFGNQFLIHTGYSGSILLDDQFAFESEMNKLPITKISELKDSAGNVLKKKEAVMPLFSLETFDFKNLPMGFFEGKIGKQNKSVLGVELLKRFNIVIDKEDSAIYMKPNSLMNLPLKDG